MTKAADRRSYHQYCGVARALDLVGDRWTLLIVRDLIPGGQRYSDLLAGLPGLTTNLLARRLDTMGGDGLVRRRKLPAPSSATIYELTALGRALEPAVLALGAFGSRSMAGGPAANDHARPRWAMVSLKRRYRGCPRPWRIELRIGGETFHLRLDPDRLEVADGPSPDADLRVTLSVQAMLAWLGGKLDPRKLARRRDVTMTGPARAWADLGRAVGARAAAA